MFRRTAIIALAIFELVWLNVIVPGHTRGAVTMAGTCSCETKPMCPRCQSSGSSHVPTPTEKAHCAVCFFAAHLDIPLASDLSPQEFRFLMYANSQFAQHLFAREVLVPFEGRGPPEIS